MLPKSKKLPKIPQKIYTLSYSVLWYLPKNISIWG